MRNSKRYLLLAGFILFISLFLANFIFAEELVSPANVIYDSRILGSSSIK